MRQQIRLDTMKDIQDFVNVVSGIDEEVVLEDGKGHCVGAQSILGVIYTTEWTRVYCYCSKDISGRILKWIV